MQSFKQEGDGQLLLTFFRVLVPVSPSWTELHKQRTNVGCLRRVSKAVSSPSSANLERNLNRMCSALGVAMVATQTI